MVFRRWLGLGGGSVCTGPRGMLRASLLLLSLLCGARGTASASLSAAVGRTVPLTGRRYLSIGDGSVTEFEFPEESEGIIVVSSQYPGQGNGTGPSPVLRVTSLDTELLTIKNVSEDELVSTLKHLVSERLNVPVRQQRLLFKGKALADGKRLSDYSIGPNSKLNLVVKPLEKVLLEESSARTVAEAPPPPPATWPLISKVLARHFSAADASRVLDQLQRDYERSLSRLTLDDIERLAGRFLHPEVTEAMEKGFSNVCFIPGLCLRIRRWLPAASTKSLDHSQQGAPSRPVA
uniref:Solute carrier family 10 member 3 n=1 Tax=Phocoena sinus TaxID=42100 RepID=A0A8C9EF60_PHOSS